MELIYSFDPERFYLGTLCKHGHAWPATNQSLRRIYKSPQGATVNHCVGCTGRRGGNWLISFVDSGAMGFADGWQLGKLCKSQHQWHGHDMTLRNQEGKCPECEQERKRSQKAKSTQRKWYLANRDIVCLQSRKAYELKKQRAAEDAEYAAELRRRSAEGTARHREARGRLSRASGLSGVMLPPGYALNKNKARICKRLIDEGHGKDIELLMPMIDSEYSLERALRRCGHLPSVAALVLLEQHRYWKKNPEDYQQFHRKRQQENDRWRRMTDAEYRLYHRQKARRRKALERGSIGIHVKGRQVAKRFAEFGDCCAYCGCTGDLHIEHVIPISKGGTHVLSNVVPACQACNFSKRDKDAELWYRAQPFFCEKRWRKILRVMGVRKGPATQLALL